MHARRLAVAAFAAASFLALPAPIAAADEDIKDASKDAATAAPKADPKTETVTKGAFSVTVDLTGTFDAKESWEVLFDAEQWGGELEVLEMAMPGPVKKGDVLARFKTDKIDEALAAGERDLTVARIGLQRQTEESKRQEESQSLALKRAETEAQNAEIAWKRFMEWEKELRLKEADQRLQQTRDNLADQEEELRQLEKMYKADELTEETEEIVLMRAKRQLARTQFWLGAQVKRDEVWRGIDLPREQDSIEMNRRQKALEFERAKTVNAGAAETARVELEKAKVGVEKQTENLEKLKRDRARFTLTAPEDGYAVYGSLGKGKWAWSDVPPTTLIALGRHKTKVNQVLFTIVKPGAVQVRTTVGEAAVLSVAEGQTAKVKPGPLPRTTLEAKVTRVARTSAGNDYEVLLDLTSADERLLPGHSCKIALTTSVKADALTVPAAAVESDGDERFVHVWDGAKSVRTAVEVGDTSKGRTEILSGVSAGDRVLAAAPKK